MGETPKVAVTVAEMARMCGLGRSRFYQLIGSAFPHPLYSIKTKRPFYTQELQQLCLEVRRRNCGIDGKPILFYCKPVNQSPAARKKNSSVVPGENHRELIEGLRALGLSLNAGQVSEAVNKLYPNGTSGVDPSSVLRSVFIHLKSKDK